MVSISPLKEKTACKQIKEQNKETCQINLTSNLLVVVAGSSSNVHMTDTSTAEAADCIGRKQRAHDCVRVHLT